MRSCRGISPHAGLQADLVGTEPTKVEKRRVSRGRLPFPTCLFHTFDQSALSTRPGQPGGTCVCKLSFLVCVRTRVLPISEAGSSELTESCSFPR